MITSKEKAKLVVLIQDYGEARCQQRVVSLAVDILKLLPIPVSVVSARQSEQEKTDAAIAASDRLAMYLDSITEGP